ncbi:MAG: hypothetical protein SF187_05195 [Deltaproteobacteria bacterium]|nr:hypothetical protein [Deltaproteobacteria bacterium]
MAADEPEATSAEAPPPPPPAADPAPPSGGWKWKGATRESTRLSLLERSKSLREQIEDLRQERAQYGIAGPIVLLGIGGGLMLTGLVFYSAATDCQDAYNSSYDSGCSGADDVKTFGAVLGISGVVLGTIGLMKISERSGPRRELGEQIKSKRAELRSVEESLRFSVITGPHNTRGLSLALRF